MAERLLNSASAGSSPSAQADAGNRDARESTHSRAVARAKREQVVVACNFCRHRKVKCDALRPCSNCRARGAECTYETQHGETYSQASKRKYDEIAQSRQEYVDVFQILQKGSEQEATEVVRYIRRGLPPDAILRRLPAGRIPSMVSDPNKSALEAFLVSLAHSTGSLRDIVTLANSTLDPLARIRMPDVDQFRAFRNHIVRLPYLKTLLERSSAPQKALTDPSFNGRVDMSDAGAPQAIATRDGGGRQIEEPEPGKPPHQVTASPWTTVTSENDAVSHLISLYLAWINPTWRFVEQDLFLEGMHSRRLDHEFCSPFLVNSICAIACLHSEHDVAFVDRDRMRITRGSHFHNEATRAWGNEENRPALSSIQGLCILALDCNYRAKDRQGLSFIQTAAQLNTEVPWTLDSVKYALRGISKHDYTRARLATHWMVVCTHIIMRLAFMNGAKSETIPSQIPKLHEVFDDKLEYWIGYPFSTGAIAHRPTLYLRERCRLAGMFQEMHDLIFPDAKQHNSTLPQFSSAVDQLLNEMQQWYQRLPFELQYSCPAVVSVWELHASYLAFSMVLLLAAKARLQDENGSSDERPPPPNTQREGSGFRSRTTQKYVSSAIAFAHRAAHILRDFRRHYGFKVTPAWLLQLQAVTAGVLVLDPELADSPTVGSPIVQDEDANISDSHTAFDEVFRSLLGTGVEVMIARGIARMMYHTALEHQIALSGSTRSLLRIMSDTAWRPSDLSLVDSVFPNFATMTGDKVSGRMTELLSKWERLDI